MASYPALVPKKLESDVPVTPLPVPVKPVEKRLEELTTVMGELPPNPKSLVNPEREISLWSPVIAFQATLPLPDCWSSWYLVPAFAAVKYKCEPSYSIAPASVVERFVPAVSLSGAVPAEDVPAGSINLAEMFAGVIPMPILPVAELQLMDYPMLLHMFRWQKVHLPNSLRGSRIR